MNEEEGWEHFLIKRYKKKQNCSLCYNAFREEDCLEFLVYKCLCKCCKNNEEIMCRFCANILKNIFICVNVFIILKDIYVIIYLKRTI